jgi:YVTN family beta-propeller protein
VTIPVGEFPWGLAYDPGASEVWVTHWDSADISVVSDLTDSVTSSFSVGSTPHFGLAYDSAKGELFLADTLHGLSNVSVVSDSNDTVLATVPVGSEPYGVAYDPEAGRLFVSNDQSNSVSVISDSTNAVVATVAVGAYPAGAVYDPGANLTFVVDQGGNAPGFGGVSVISPASNGVVATIPLGGNPFWPAYDSAKGELFVTVDNNSNPRAGLVDVISDKTDRVVATVPVGPWPTWPVYLPNTGEVLVANANSNNVSVISDANNTVVATVAVGSSPYGLVYDEARGELFAANEGSADLTVTRAPVYSVTFTEHRLASGTNWTVILNGSQDFSTTSSITFAEPNGTFPYAVGSANTSWAAPSGSVEVAGSETSVAVTFSLLTYPITFSETGLANGTSWGVSVQTGGLPGSDNCEAGYYCFPLDLSQPNGSYAYSVAVPPGYTASPSAGTIKVQGGPVNQPLTFALLPSDHVVTFLEHGLSGEWGWMATVTYTAPQVVNNLTLYGLTAELSSSDPVMALAVPNGTYDFYIALAHETVDGIQEYRLGLAPDPAYGTFRVDGANLNQTIDFVPGYEVTFQVQGDLPFGTEWFVNLSGGPSYTSTTPYIAFVESNGTWSYGIGSANTAYRAPGGSFAVNGSALYEVALFSPVTYTITFALSGAEPPTTLKLLERYGWTLGFNGTVARLTSTSADVYAQNGSYPYLLSGPGGYQVVAVTSGATSLPVAGNLSVRGSNLTVTVTIAKGPTYLLRFVEAGLPRAQSWCGELERDVECSTTTVVRFLNLTPGKYLYGVVSPLAGQHITAKVGTTPVALDGAWTVATSVAVALTFVYPYAVTFRESGLSTGTWSVTVRGMMETNRTGEPITFNLKNGTYAYAVVAVPGYTSLGSPRSVVVRGAGVPVAVTFTLRAGGPVRANPVGELLFVVPAVPATMATRRRGSSLRTPRRTG